MKLAEYSNYDAVGLADLVRRGEVKPSELAALAAQAIEAVNPKLNAVLELFADRIDGLDEASIPEGPFRGVPFALKDIGASEAGRKQECGSRIMAGHVAAADTELTRRFRASGLVNLGRTACPEFGLTMTTEPVLSGVTCNPWDPSRIAGGSSGGAGASVAAGALPMAHANDGGGSTRIPAAINGLVGLKCSRGRVTMGPDFSDLTYFLISELAVTRTVRDTAALLDAVHGPAPGEAFLPQPPARAYTDELNDPPKNLKIAFAPGTWMGQPLDPEVSDAVRRTAALCESLGHTVEEATPKVDGDVFIQAFGDLWAADGLASLEAVSQQMGRPVTGEYVEKITEVIYAAGKALPLSAYLDAKVVVDQTTRAVGTFFEDYDVLLTPTLAKQTPPTGIYGLDREGVDYQSWLAEALALIPWTPLANMTGTPAISLPLAMDSAGLPMGMHFMAGIGQEARLIGLAAALEAADPWAGRRPAVHVAN